MCHDPIFGTLIYEDGIWSHVPRRPGDGMMIHVEVPAIGPSKQQREFYQFLLPTLPSLEAVARDFIRQQIIEATDFSTLSIYAIEMRADASVQNQRFVLELTDENEVLIHRVAFESTTPIHYTYDD